MTSDTPLSPLDADGVAAAVDAALVAIAGASDLDALKSARLAHTGDTSPLALANRAIGGLPGSEFTTWSTSGRCSA